MTEEDEEVTAVVVCAPLDWEHTPTSVQMSADCGHEVWVAPSGVKMLYSAEDKVVLRCVICVTEAAKRGDIDLREAKPVPGSTGELARELGIDERNAARLIKEILK